MKCPDCENETLATSELENHLPAQVCNACGGIWLDVKSYREWHGRCGQRFVLVSETPYQAAQTVAEEQDQARLCPDCGVIMLKWRVGHGLSFMIDRCCRCKGIWLGSEEWQALKGQNLHEEIERVFSSAWQAAERRASMRAKLLEVYRERFGQDFDKIESFRRWVHDQPRSTEILDYLQDTDPFDLLSNRDVDQTEEILQARLRNFAKDDGGVTTTDPG